MDPVTPLALTLAPEIGRWLFDDATGKVTTAVAQAIQSVTGTTDANAANLVLQQKPEMAADLRVKLAQIASEAQRAANSADLAALTQTVQDATASAAQSVGPTAPLPAIAWSAPIISTVVLLTFGGVMAIVLARGVPAGNETAANMLLGTLAAMATSVVSYWVGSSAGSARKDERLAQATRPTPPG